MDANKILEILNINKEIGDNYVIFNFKDNGYIYIDNNVISFKGNSYGDCYSFPHYIILKKGLRFHFNENTKFLNIEINYKDNKDSPKIDLFLNTKISSSENKIYPELNSYARTTIIISKFISLLHTEIKRVNNSEVIFNG